jgi:hypothetical protein
MGQGDPQQGGGADPRAGNQAQSNIGMGETRSGGGANADGTAWNNINTGNNHYGKPGQHVDAAGGTGALPDYEQTYEQGMRALTQLRQTVQGDPLAAKEVEQLARQMRQLDPGRFPGNPDMVEQMHREVLSSVDRLELELQRDAVSTDARSGKPFAIPQGYQDRVAEYYRQLSRNP